jgi:hypothetical protein
MKCDKCKEPAEFEAKTAEGELQRYCKKCLLKLVK